MSEPQGVPFPVDIPRKRVMVRMSIVYPFEISHNTSPEFVNFYLNEGTHCISNELLALVDRYVGDDDTPPTSGVGCACDLYQMEGERLKFEYVRDATEDDR